MPGDPILRALAACGTECLQAADGRGRRWALHRCRQALEQHGTPPAIAARSAQAMAEVARVIQARAAGTAAPRA